MGIITWIVLHNHHAQKDDLLCMDTRFLADRIFSQLSFVDKEKKV